MKLQSYGYVISVNIVMYDWAPEVLLVHVLEWLHESGSLRYSSETDDDYNLSLSNSLPPRAVTRYSYLSGTPLQMEMWPYHFKQDLPPTTLSTTDYDTNDGVHYTIFLSFYLLIVWGILTGKLVGKYKMAFIA